MNKLNSIFLTVLLLTALEPLPAQKKTDVDKKTEELFKMSLQELMNVEVERSITKQPGNKTWTLIMLKIISMDKNFHRLGTPIKIGISSNNLFKTLKSMENKITINGKPFTAHKITSPASAAQYKILYIGKERGAKRFTDMQTLAENGAFIFCSDEKSVLFGPAAVLFKVVNKYPHVALNLENAREQGAEFREEDLEAVVTVGKD